MAANNHRASYEDVADALIAAYSAYLGDASMSWDDRQKLVDAAVAGTGWTEAEVTAESERRIDARAE